MGTPVKELPSPDEPWLRPEDVATGPGHVYRVRYITNQIEVLVQTSKAAPNKYLVKDLDGGPETWIDGRDVYSVFEAAKERLCMLNAERVRLAQADLARAEQRLGESRRMYLADGSGGEDEDEDEVDAPSGAWMENKSHV
jgi:hypothetical protein